MGIFRNSAVECNQKGLKALEGQRTQKALELFLKACDRDPTSGVYFYNAGIAFSQLGAHAAAHDALCHAETRGFESARELIDATDWCALLPDEATPEPAESSGLGALIGFVAVGDAVGAKIGDFLEGLIIGSSETTSSPYGQVACQSVLHGVHGPHGRSIQVACSVELGHLMWRTCSLRIYIYHSNGNPVVRPTIDEWTTTTGCLSIQKSLTPRYRVSEWTELELFVPYSALPLPHAEDGLQTNLQVYGPGNTLLASEAFYFDWDTHVSRASSRGNSGSNRSGGGGWGGGGSNRSGGAGSQRW